MRHLWLALVLVGVFAAVPQRTIVAAGASHPIVAAADMAQAAPAKDVNVDINLHSNARAWYRSPVWIALAVLAIIVLAIIVALIARGGGGTTIIRE
jgi:hypothetical protein